MRFVSTFVLALIGVFAALIVVPVDVDGAFPGSNGPIAFEHEAPAGDHTQADIYVLRPGQTTASALTNTPNRNEFGPAYSPDGTRIAYWRTRAPFGPGSLWIMDADGSHKKQLTRGFDARDPAWSPDGKRLVFTAASKDGVAFDLWVLRLRDGKLTQLTAGAPWDFEPAWSPDGKTIAFTRGFEQGDAGDIYVIDITTKAISHVTGNRGYDHQVGWAPDGSRLIFERDSDVTTIIATVHADGTGLTRLTNGRSFDDGPAYSPDGSRIAFGSDRGGDDLGELWVMNADGSGKKRLVRMQYGEGFPDWGVARE